MTAGFKALGDYGIAAIRFQEARFGNSRCRTDHLGAGPVHPLDQLAARQSIMKAHYIWLEFFNNSAHCGIERLTVCHWHRRGGIDSQFDVIPD